MAAVSMKERLDEGTPISELARKLESDLFDRYGPVIGGKNLSEALGYRSVDAFRQAACRKTVPVPIFTIENRRGRFALVSEVAQWLAQQRYPEEGEGTTDISDE